MLRGTYAICRLAPGEPLPGWVQRSGDFVSITVTLEEISVVCASSAVPEGVQSERGWAALKVEGPLPLQMTGVLAALVTPLAEADIPVFVVSTFDTDYLLVKQDDLPAVKSELERFGHALCLKRK